MSANKPTDTPNTTTGAGASSAGKGTTGSSTGATGSTTGAGSKTDASSELARTTTGSTGGTGAATAPAGVGGAARQYGDKIAEGASRAKDYVSEKASVVGERFQELRNKDYAQMAEDAKTYARQNPGQALLISAAAGFVLGLLLRGSRR